MAITMDALLKVTATGDASGLNVIQKGLKAVTQQAEQTKATFSTLGDVFGPAVLGAGIGVLSQSLLQAGEDANLTAIRVRGLAGAYGEVQEVQRFAAQSADLFALSTLDATKEVINLYGRLRPMGVSLKDIETIYSGISKAAKLMGLSQADLSAVTLQLSQALGSGRLQGDEFRAIMERMPIIGTAVAQALGISVGQLKVMSTEGRITTDVMIRASQILNTIKPPPPTEIQRFTAANEDLRQELGSQLLPLLTPYIKTLEQGLEIFKKLPGPVKGSAVAFLTFSGGVFAAALSMRALAIASAQFAAIRGGPVAAILAGGVGAGFGALALASALKDAKLAAQGINEAGNNLGTVFGGAATQAERMVAGFVPAKVFADQLTNATQATKQEQEAFNVALQYSNDSYKILLGTIETTKQTLEGQTQLQEATFSADIAVNNAAKSILQSKLGQAKTDQEKLSLTIQIMQLDLENARLQKDAAAAKIQAEVNIADLKRQSAWTELRQVDAALQLAEAHGEDTRTLRTNLELAKQAANQADRQFILAGRIASERTRAANAEYIALQYTTQASARLAAQQYAQSVNRLSNIEQSSVYYSTTNEAGGSVAGQRYRITRLPGGGSINELMPPGFARGAYVMGPTAAVFGEREPEYAIPASRMAAASAAYLSGARGPAVLAGGGGGGAAPQINIQTGPVLQAQGQQWVSMADLQQAMQITAQTIYGNLRTPAGRRAIAGA